MILTWQLSEALGKLDPDFPVYILYDGKMVPLTVVSGHDAGTFLSGRQDSASTNNAHYFYSIPIDILDLSIRANNCLKAEKICSIGTLLEYTKPMLESNINLGGETIEEIIMALYTHGIPALGTFKK